jgi:hypothetical protein
VEIVEKLSTTIFRAEEKRETAEALLLRQPALPL